MSDALSEIARDEKKGRLHEAYLQSLIDFLKSRDNSARAKAVSVAKEVDSVDGGYWASGHTEYSKNIDETLAKLAADDHECWAKLLKDVRDTNLFAEFKALSPF